VHSSFCERLTSRQFLPTLKVENVMLLTRYCVTVVTQKVALLNTLTMMFVALLCRGHNVKLLVNFVPLDEWVTAAYVLAAARNVGDLPRAAVLRQ
jgi:hypothetical protein